MAAYMRVLGLLHRGRSYREIAEDLIPDANAREHTERDQLTLHADRDGPMIAGVVTELLLGLGVTKSHSRPRVSNDNPYSEAQFKTLEIRPDYPDRFESANAANEWCSAVFDWCNTARAKLDATIDGAHAPQPITAPQHA